MVQLRVQGAGSLLPVWSRNKPEGARPEKGPEQLINPQTMAGAYAHEIATSYGSVVQSISYGYIW